MSPPQEICLGLDVGATKFACIATTVSSLLDSSFFKKPTLSHLAHTDHAYKLLTGPSFSVESFDKVLDKFLSQLNDTYNNNYKIVSIGLAICGFIDKEGIISYCGISILDGWNPIKYLKNKFGHRVRLIIFNDAVAGLEHIRREWPGVKDLSFIVAGTGIGTAFLRNGQISAAGNYGISPMFLPQHYISRVESYTYRPMDPTLPPPTMKLGELAGGKTLARIITQEIGVSVEEAIKRLSKYSSPKELLSIPTSDESNDIEIDKKLLKVVLDWATVFGIAVSNIICLFSPKILVISGGVLNFPFHADRVMEIGKEYAGELWDKTLVVRSYWSNDLVVRGALVAAYDKGK